MSGDAERDAELALLREKLARSELLVTDLRTAANVNAESHLASRIATAKTLAIVQAELEASETKLVRAEKTIARMGLEGAPPPSPVPPAPARSSLATASSELPGLADYTRRLPERNLAYESLTLARAEAWVKMDLLKRELFAGYKVAWAKLWNDVTLNNLIEAKLCESFAA